MWFRESVIDAAAHRGGLKLQPCVAVDRAWTDYGKIERNVFVAPEFPALWRFFSFFQLDAAH